MKRCPECRRTYTDPSQAFCLHDGRPLETVEAPAAPPPPSGNVPVVTLSKPDTPAPFFLPSAPFPSGSPESTPPSVPVLPAVPPLSSETARPFAPVLTQTQPPPPSSPPGYLPPPTGGYSPPPGYNNPAPPSIAPSPAPAPNASRSAFLPIGIVVGLIVLFSFYRQNQRSPSAPPGNVPAINIPTAPSEPSGEARPNAKADAAAIVNAIQRSDEAESQALKTLDPASLSEWYAGAALQRELTQVESLKTQGRYAETHLDKQTFQNAEMSRDGQQAKVRVVETWTSTTYDAQTRQPVGQQNAQTIPQTVTLQRNGDKWLVTNVEQ